MINYLELPIGEKAPEVINAVIEIPLEGINKYEYDKKLHVFRLDRNLYSPVHYPGDYGFIPATLSSGCAGIGGCGELSQLRDGSPPHRHSRNARSGRAR
jgi:inorganic pyrophosphatase